MLKSLLALAIIAWFTVQAVRSHYAAMLMYWWFGIFRPQDWMWWDLSAFRLPLLAALIFVVPLLFKARLPRLDNVMSISVMALLAVAVLSELFVSCDYPGPVRIDQVAILITITLFTCMLITNQRSLLGAMIIVSLSLSLLQSKTGWVMAMKGNSLYGTPIGGGSFLGSNAIALGNAMSVFFLAAIYQCISRSPKAGESTLINITPKLRLLLKLAMMMIIIGTVLFVMVTYSRGSAIGLCAGMLVWALLHPRRIKLTAALLVAGFLVIATVGIPGGYSERIESAFVGGDELDGSAASRGHFWRTAQLMASDHPFGVGTGCYSSYYSQYDSTGGLYGTRRSVHSSHFLILAELGYPGFFIWIILLWSCALNLWRTRAAAMLEVSKDSCHIDTVMMMNGLLAALVVFVLAGSFYEMAYNDFTWLLFAFGAAARKIYSDRV